jgi:hypothetical protein
MISELLKKYSSQENSVWLFHLLLMVIAYTEHSIKFPYNYLVMSVGAVNLAFQHAKLSKYSFGFYALIFTYSLANDYLMAANHFFLVTYLIWYYALLHFKLVEPFRYNHFLLVLVMGVATFQKVLSTDFTSGSFMASIFLPGHSMSFMHKLIIQDFQTMSANYSQLVGLVKAEHPSEHLWHIDVLESFRFYCKMQAYIIIIFELAMVLILLFFRSEIRYGFLLAFLYGTLAFRPEYAFFSSLCLLALMDTKLENVWIRKALLVTAILFLSLGSLQLIF